MDNHLMNEKKQINECIEYFRNSSIWKRIFKGFKEKYSSYGRFSGKVIVRNPEDNDIEELEGFFGQNFHGKRSITISAEKFEKALKNSRFKEVSPEEILNAYFGERLLGKSEVKAIRQQRLSEIRQEFFNHYRQTAAYNMFEQLEGCVKRDSRFSQNEAVDSMLEAVEEWKKDIWFCADVYNSLPYRSNDKMYLAVFAAKLTGNPHAFDSGTKEGGMLYQVILIDLINRGMQVETSELFHAYKRQKSYFLAGIMIDDISNYAMLYNIHAYKPDGSIHKGIEGFFEEKDIVQLTLNIISELDTVECIDNEIYIVENPSVFAMLCGKKSCMCMNGQPRLACLMMLELLAKSGTRVYYSGDLDPEGLLIAQKLSGFYTGEFNYWHMGKLDYDECISKEMLSDRRVKMLDNISDERLLEVACEMRRCMRAGYQENITYEDFHNALSPT